MDKQSSSIELRVDLRRFADDDVTCRCCGGGGLEVFYRIPDVPIQSCLLMATEQQARTLPRGDLRLAFCPMCGFIQNTAFDPAVIRYDGEYEAAQGFSGTFNAFADGLADRLIESCDLRGKRALEVGCGDGRFLEALCRKGVAEGIGVDPAFIGDALSERGREKLTFLREELSIDHADLEADFVCCRHTLEHLPDVRDTVELMRRCVADRENATVFIEVPDVARQLRIGAFWDFYYEHCSYFSAGSLSRLMRTNRFDLRNVWLDYAGQYLLLTAAPAHEATTATLAIEDDLQEMRELVANCADVMATRLAHWMRIINDAVDSGQRVIIWASGSKCVGFLTTLGLDEQIDYVVDINPAKQGTFIPGTGHEIVGPERLKTQPPDLVLVMNPVYLEEIAQEIAAQGVLAECVAV